MQIDIDADADLDKYILSVCVYTYDLIENIYFLILILNVCSEKGGIKSFIFCWTLFLSKYIWER